MPWIELHTQTTADYADSFSDQLTLLGALAVTFQDAGDQPIYEPTPGALHLWPETIVIGLFDESLQPESLITYLEDQQAGGLIERFHFKNLPDQDWERVCLDYFKPMAFGKRLWICPSWQTPPVPNAANVVLDPGLAFGTGTHTTTALCLEWLDQHSLPGTLVIDYGCGSGILGLAALKLGAKEVIAIDNDPQALEASLKNAARNPEIAANFHAFLANDFNSPILADLLIANILAQPLIDLAPLFATLTHPNSDILLSGILVEQADAVIAAYQPWFSFKKPITQQKEWARLEGKRK